MPGCATRSTPSGWPSPACRSTLDGKQHYLDSRLAYQRACHHAIDYLMKFGYTDIQAYMILGAAPVEGRLSGVVDIPNSCSTIYIPTRDLRLRRAPVGRRAAAGQQGMAVPKASF